MVAVETADVLEEHEVLAVGAVKTSHPYSDVDNRFSTYTVYRQGELGGNSLWKWDNSYRDLALARWRRAVVVGRLVVHEQERESAAKRWR
jgi:prophage tail gpP-like protein